MALIFLAFSQVFLPLDLRIENFLKNIFRVSSLVEENNYLRKINLDLENKLSQLSSQKELVSQNGYLPAKVFSLYPYNLKSRLYLDVGEKDGVRVGSPVLFSETVLVGVISNVWKTRSEVMTVFDPNFSLAVRIGEEEIDGLLEGGLNPKVGLISKNKVVSSGERVVSASKDFPYGLLVGKVKSIKEDTSGAFWEAFLELPYTLSDLREVLIKVGENN